LEAKSAKIKNLKVAYW